MSEDATAAWHVLRDSLKATAWARFLKLDVIGLGGARLKSFTEAVNVSMSLKELMSADFAQVLRIDVVVQNPKSAD